MSQATRLDIRVSVAQKRLIERAAEIRGSSLTDFVIAATREAATAIVEDHEILRLHNAGRETFVNALLNPPSPNKTARAAAARYKKRMDI